MKILFAGGTGFIGKSLTESLIQQNHNVVVLTRSIKSSHSPNLRFVSWDPFQFDSSWESELEGADAVINLAGEPIANKRWTTAQKKALLESRLSSVTAINRAIRKASQRPKVLLNASAVGYYGSRGDEILDESSKPGTGFLAELCQRWEEAVMEAESLNVRAIRLRIGLVLEKGGGALGKMLPPFQLGLGGPLGDGKQWMSWIHRGDLIRLILFLLDHSEAHGTINGTSLNPVRMSEFAKTLGRILGRPAIFPVPAALLRILLGELSEMLLTGQCVLPQRAIQLGFSFQYPTLNLALEDILKSKP